MAKHDHSSKKTDDTIHQQSSTEIHVETSSEQNVSGGEAVNEHLDELTADLKRVQAEFVNFKRRADAERAETMEYAKSRVVREFLGVRDSFDQEIAHRPKTVDKGWADSINSIRAQFDKAMKSLGVERFDSLGHAFDPHRHEAILMEDGEGAHEVVTEELQAGYQQGDTILRHAVVKVGRSDKVKAD